MLLITGLGNPEAKYAKTGNIGFMAIDALARHFAFPLIEKFHGLVSDGLINNTKCCCSPQTL